MKGEQLLMMGDWVLSLNLLHLGGQGQSSARGTIPMPTKFIKQVTILMHMALEVTSWNNWAENMVDPTI